MLPTDGETRQRVQAFLAGSAEASTLMKRERDSEIER
jgi:hypothetical protein